MFNLTKKTLGFGLTATALAVSSLAAHAQGPQNVLEDTTNVVIDKDRTGDFGYSNDNAVENLTINEGITVSGSVTGISLMGKLGSFEMGSGAVVEGHYAGLSLGGGITGVANIKGATLTASQDESRWQAAGLMILGDASKATFNIQDSQLSGYNGIRAAYTNVGDINITGASKVTGKNVGLFIQNSNANNVTIGQGAEVSGGVAGIWSNRTVNSFKIDGSVSATQTAMNFLGGTNVKEGVNITGNVSGGWAGLYLEYGQFGTEGSTQAGLAIENGASVTSEQDYGVKIAKSGKIYGGIDVTNSTVSGHQGGFYLAGTVSGGQYGLNVGTGSFVNSINIQGTVAGQTSGLKISGTVGAEGTMDPVVTVGKNASLTGTSGYAIENDGQINGAISLAGTITGGTGAFINRGAITNGITFDGTSDLTVINAGQISGAVTATGSGKITIESWNLATDSDRLVVNGTNANNVTVNNVTYSDVVGAAGAVKTQSGIDMKDRLVNETKAAETQPETEGRVPTLTTSTAELSADVQRLGFASSWDSTNQMLAVELSQDATAGGVLGQAVAQQSVRRDFFIDTMVDDAVASALYNANVNKGNGTVFVKPYASSDSYDMGGSDFDGNTYGLLLGANYVQNDAGITAFMGYETSKFDANYVNGSLGAKADTYYLGATGFANIAKVANYDVFVKVGAKAGFTRNELSRTISGADADTKTNSLTWSVKAQTGVNLDLSPNTIITPSVGLGYASASINDFGLTNTSSKDSYNLNTVSMPYAEFGVNWMQGWTKTLRTNFGAGFRYMFDKTQDITSTFTSNTPSTGAPQSLSGEYELSNSYEFLTASATWTINKSNEVSFGYTSVFSNDGQSHNVTAKYEYLF